MLLKGFILTKSIVSLIKNKMQVIENNLNLSKNAIFNLMIQTMNNEVIGNLTVYIHPEDKKGRNPSNSWSAPR